MRLPNTAIESHPWRIREITTDFRLEDVWALPAYGGADDFQRLLAQTLSADPVSADSFPTRVLWGLRGVLAKAFHLGRIALRSDGDDAARPLPIPGTDETSLAGRLPAELRGTAGDLQFRSRLFAPVYCTDTEFAAELSNATVHGVMHLAWVDRGAGRFQGQMAVYVKPRGRLGRAYMALITPFRHWIVYPALMRRIEAAWNRPATSQH